MAVNPAYLTAVKAASAKYGVPAQLLAAQIQAESGWNPNAKSPAGATGISQFMPGTAKGMGIDPTDPLASIDAQGRMMSRLLKSYNGNVDKALAAYNAGAGAVAKYNGVPPFTETHQYIDRIKSYESNYPGLAAARSIANMKSGGVPTPTISVGPSQTLSQPSLAQSNGNGQVNNSSPLESLLNYAMQGSAPPHDGAEENNSILNILAQTQDSSQVPQPTLGQQPNTTNTPNSAVTGTTGLTGSQMPKTNSTIVDAAQKFLGTPYLWGGTTAKGLDCSGLVQLAVKNATGKTIPRVAADQYKASQKVPQNQMQPGDIIAFGTPTNVHHIGIYVGSGKFIDAPHTGAKVRIDDLSGRTDIVGAGRFS